MPGPTNGDSSVTPSRSGTPVCAFSMKSRYSGTDTSSACRARHGVAKFPPATTRGTGRPPGQHGLLGYEVGDPGTGTLLDALRWERGMDPREWQPGSTIFERAVAAGVGAFRVAPGHLHASGLSVGSMRGAEYESANTLGALVSRTAAVLAASACAGAGLAADFAPEQAARPTIEMPARIIPPRNVLDLNPRGMAMPLRSFRSRGRRVSWPVLVTGARLRTKRVLRPGAGVTARVRRREARDPPQTRPIARQATSGLSCRWVGLGNAVAWRLRLGGLPAERPGENCRRPLAPNAVARRRALGARVGSGAAGAARNQRPPTRLFFCTFRRGNT